MAPVITSQYDLSNIHETSGLYSSSITASPSRVHKGGGRHACMCLDFTTALVYPQVLREEPDIIFPTKNTRCAFTLACVRACECMCVVLYSVNIYIGIWCHDSSSWNVMEVECCVACEWGSCSGIHAPYHVDGNHFQMTSYPKYKTYPRSEGLFTCLAISSLLYMNMLWMWCHLKMIGTCLTLMHAWFNCLHLLACLLANVHHPWEIHFYGTPTWTV